MASSEGNEVYIVYVVMVVRVELFGNHGIMGCPKVSCWWRLLL